MTDERTYLVVVNDEDQYSIWAQDTVLPAGWRGEGFTGSRDDCLSHIEQVWTDMRPRSLRLAMQQVASGSPADR
jgi:MbtH protein